MTKEVPKYGAQDILQFVGLNELPIEEQATVNTLSTEYFEKIKRKLNNVTKLIVHIKRYQKAGGKPKFSAHVRCIAPTKTLESCNADDWELARCVHKAFEDVIHQIAHVFHTDVSRRTD